MGSRPRGSQRRDSTQEEHGRESTIESAMSHHTENNTNGSMGACLSAPQRLRRPPGSRRFGRPWSSKERSGSDGREQGTAADLLKVPEVREEGTAAADLPEVPEFSQVLEGSEILEAHDPGGIGKLSIGSSSSNEVKTCQVEVVVGGLSFSYSVPPSWRLCQGKEYAGFEVDELPTTEIFEFLKSQHPSVEVCWESGALQLKLKRSWVRHQVELRGVSVELTVPCSWKLIQSSEYKCVFFAVEDKPEEDVLIRVQRQQQPELEGLKVQFLDGIVVVRMPSGPDSDRAHLFQRQFDCYLSRRNLPAKWLTSVSSSLYSYSGSGKCFVPDFAVVDRDLANEARMEQIEAGGDISAVYKDVRLLVGIEFQSKTERIKHLKAKARDMLSVCTDLVICFMAYNNGEVWVYSSENGESMVREPRFLMLDSVAEGLRLYTSCLPEETWPYRNDHRDISFMKASRLVKAICVAVEDGDVALAEEAINYLDDMDLKCGEFSILLSAAKVQSVECIEYMFRNGAHPATADDAYVMARSTRNEGMCHIFEEQGCCFEDLKQLTLQAIQGKNETRAMWLINSSPTVKASDGFWPREDLEDFLSEAVINNVPTIANFLLDMGVKPFLEDALQACYHEEMIQLLLTKDMFLEEEKQEMQQLHNRLKRSKQERKNIRNTRL